MQTIPRRWNLESFTRYCRTTRLLLTASSASSTNPAKTTFTPRGTSVWLPYLRRSSALSVALGAISLPDVGGPRRRQRSGRRSPPIRSVSVPSHDLRRTAVARVSRRLIPFLFLLYILNFLDRVNVGFAALEMNRDLGFGPAVYGFGAGRRGRGGRRGSGRR
jgi:hypothetical protein